MSTTRQHPLPEINQNILRSAAGGTVWEPRSEVNCIHKMENCWTVKLKDLEEVNKFYMVLKTDLAKQVTTP
jgi:hypothetical protein